MILSLFFRDLGVFIGALDQDGFAGKSGNLCVSDRILACNGEDFTQESNERFFIVCLYSCLMFVLLELKRDFVTWQSRNLFFEWQYHVVLTWTYNSLRSREIMRLMNLTTNL